MAHSLVFSLRSPQVFDSAEALRTYRIYCQVAVRADFLGLAFLVAAGSQTSHTFLALGKGFSFFQWAKMSPLEATVHTTYSDAFIPIFIEELLGLFLLYLAVYLRLSIRVLSFQYFTYLHQPIPSYEEFAPADIASSWGTLRNYTARVTYRIIKILVILFSYSALITG